MVRRWPVSSGSIFLLGMGVFLAVPFPLPVIVPLTASAQPRDPGLDPPRDPEITRLPEVTSDTPEYCGELAERISGMVRATSMPPSAEVRTLSVEGQRMCVHGQTRGGIMRLRRAIAIMLHTED
jgi:hypothetical protein